MYTAHTVLKLFISQVHHLQRDYLDFQYIFADVEKTQSRLMKNKFFAVRWHLLFTHSVLNLAGEKKKEKKKNPMVKVSTASWVLRATEDLPDHVLGLQCFDDILGSVHQFGAFPYNLNVHCGAWKAHIRSAWFQGCRLYLWRLRYSQNLPVLSG